jgi:hypothetical protein
MSKKIMLLALVAVSAAMCAMPAVASANFNHLSAGGAFIVHGPAGNFNTVEGKTIACKTTTGEGSFATTTTGIMKLVFHGCGTVVLGFTFNCTTAGLPTGTIETTQLGIHLVTIDNSDKSPGVLITPAAGEQFAHVECAGQAQTWTGNGIVGTVTSPNCGGTSNTATVDFNPLNNEHGKQEHRLVTGTSYGLLWSGIEAAFDTHATFTFEGARTLVCT